MTDNVNHPLHYGGDVPLEAIKVIENWGWGFPFCVATALKYVVRAGKKNNEVEDLKKAEWYIARALDQKHYPEARKRGSAPYDINPTEVAAFHKLDANGHGVITALKAQDCENALRLVRVMIKERERV